METAGRGNKHFGQLLRLAGRFQFDQHRKIVVLIVQRQLLQAPVGLVFRLVQETG
ncbi:hypothetical protein D3C81_2192100 [compost metagenome]